MESMSRKMMRYGLFLFLLGLVTGLMEQRFMNMRMGLSAHLEGVMNGIFLIALGAAWPELSLPSLAKGIAYGLALFGTYANWLFTTLGAIFGTAVNNPIAAAGHHGRPWQESFVGAGFLGVAFSMIVMSLLVLWGLRPKVSDSH